MTRLLEPLRVEHTITVDSVAVSVMLPGVYTLRAGGTVYYVRSVPKVLTGMLQSHGKLDVKIRRFENTQHIETILSIRKAR